MAAARSHRENTLPLSEPKKKPATKARPTSAKPPRKENPALSGRDQGKERSEQPDASAVAEATIFAKPSWHDPDRVSRVTLHFVTLGAEDEAAVDRAIKLLDLIDQKTLARKKERAEEIKRLEEEANTPSHLDFRQGVVFITGQGRPDRAEVNFSEYLVCWTCSFVPIDDMKEEVARSLRGIPLPDETQTSLRYITTPTAIWDAEVVFVDEINRSRRIFRTNSSRSSTNGACRGGNSRNCAIAGRP